MHQCKCIINIYQSSFRGQNKDPVTSAGKQYPETLFAFPQRLILEFLLCNNLVVNVCQITDFILADAKQELCLARRRGEA